MQCIFAFIPFIALASCGPTAVVNAQPPLVDYTYAQQKKAAAELRDARQRYLVIPEMIDDYGSLRAAIRNAGK